jgi:RNA polymerase sigma-70 factor (ECF subfamily)
MDEHAPDDRAPDDRTLVVRMAHNPGDAGAITAFYQRWFRQFYACAVRYTGKHEVAEDLAQEAVIRVIGTASTYDPTRPVRAWLLTIARNLSVDWLRRNRPQVAIGTTDPDAGDDGGQALELADRAPTVHERAVARERAAALRRALDLLTETERDVLVLRDFRELSPAETAAVLGIPVGRVGSRLHRARKRLGELLMRECPALFSGREL